MNGESSSAGAGRRVLFLAYYFPPLGGGGVQRSLAFTNYLPERGYEPVVVTGPAAGAVQWGPVDESLGARMRGRRVVLRAEGPEPEHTGGWTCRALRWLRLEEEFSRWWVRSAIARGREAVVDTDVIYASMSPFETAQAAAQLARESGKPWVADLRDPWALDDWLVFPTRLHRWLELRTMRRSLASAAAIVMNTPESKAELLRRAPELRDRPVLTIPNGYDPADFAGAPPERADGLFRIVHAGHLHTKPERASTRLGRRLLGGSPPGLETRARSHVYLVRALDALLERRPELRGQLRLELVGPVSDADAAQLPDYAVAYGYVPHGKTIDLLRSADLLFLPMHGLAEGLRARIVPGKTYEYLAAETPILAAVPGGDARELLSAAGNADLCAPSDDAAISRALERRVDAWLAGMPPPLPDPTLLHRFDRRRLTAELAEVFDTVLGARAREPTPLRAEVPA